MAKTTQDLTTHIDNKCSFSGLRVQMYDMDDVFRAFPVTQNSSQVHFSCNYRHSLQRGRPKTKSYPCFFERCRSFFLIPCFYLVICRSSLYRGRFCFFTLTSLFAPKRLSFVKISDILTTRASYFPTKPSFL